MSERIIIGRLGAPYGIHGWLKITSDTSPPENILNYHAWQIKRGNQWSIIEPEKTDQHGQKLLVKLPGCDSPEIAKQWTNALIAVFRDELPELPDDEFYWNDLIGCEVTNTNGVILGKVTQLFETGANDVMIVQANKRRCLIPYTDDTVIQINLTCRRITVEWDPEF